MADYRTDQVEIPELLGLCNFEDWKRAVSVHLSLSCVAAFISTNPPTKPAGDEDSHDVTKWLARRTLAWWCIRSSIGDSAKMYLEIKGWNGIRDDEDQDPKALWDEVTTTLGTPAADDQTLSDQIQANGAPLPTSLVRRYLASLVRELEELYTDQGLAVAFLDARRIRTGRTILPRIESYILNITFTGRPLPCTALTLPELELNGRKGGDLRKADVWLLGIVAAQMITGRHDLVADLATATSLKNAYCDDLTDDALEHVVPDYEQYEALAEGSVGMYFVRRCLTIDSEHRPSIAELRDHPFLDSVE